MRRGLALALLFLSGAGVAQSGPLMVLLTTNSAGRELLVDRNSLRTLPPLPGTRNFSATELRVEIRSPGGRRGGPVTERVLYSFDCKTRRVATLSYVRGPANGRRSHDWKGADYSTRYEDVQASSLTETAMAFACSGGKMPVAPVPVTEGKDEDEEL